MKTDELFTAVNDAEKTLLTPTEYDFPPITFEYERGVKETEEAILRHVGLYNEYLKWKGVL